jgi:hypothetical protein
VSKVPDEIVEEIEEPDENVEYVDRAEEDIEEEAVANIEGVDTEEDGT